jgi:NADH-quinone oxidoreductase subunit F
MAVHGDGTENESIVRVSASSHKAETEVFRAAHEAAESTPVVEVGPTGVDGLSPLVLATHEGETAFVPRCSIEHAQSIAATLDDGTLPDDAETVVGHASDTATLPTPQTGPLGIGSRHALASCGWSVPASIADYTESRENGLLTAHFMGDSETVREYIMASGLRGRGRGDMSTDAPIADNWKTVREATGDPVVVVNGNETDDHAAGDCLLLESAPLTVLDPALAAAHALDATAVVVHVNETETVAHERMEEAVDALTDATDTGISISVVAGPDEYKAGEPTMALEVLEGNHRIEARRGPPGPNTHGLDGRPTLIHTPRTFAQVGRVLDGDDLVGASSDPGTRLFTIAGDVAVPATVELSTGATLDAALPAVDTQNGQKAACVGGVFGGLTRSLDVPASAPGLNGAHLGTNGVMELLDDSTCTVALAGERAKFAREENCGRCVPCREGSKQLVELLRDVYSGEYKDGMLRELTRVMRDTSLCGFGHDAARPVTTAMEEFETEFNAHARGRCPTGACDHP